MNNGYARKHSSSRDQVSKQESSNLQASSPQSHRTGGPATADGAVRPWLRNGLLVAALLCVAAFVLFFRNGRTPENAQVEQAWAPAVQEPASQNTGEKLSTVQQADVELARKETVTANPTVAHPAAAVPTAALAPKPEPSAQTRQLVGSLCQLTTAPGAMTTEQVLQWTLNWHALVEQGGAAVPAIVEFLEKNLDYGFGAGGSALGYVSARAAMFDALLEIGGAEGINGMLQVLQHTADPREIALLAQSLEKLAPEQYRQEAVTAATQALAMAAKGKLPGMDMAPLFQVLQNYGGAGAVAELEQAAKNWNYYATMGLAQLPDGAGIPSLIQMARSNTGAGGNALEMLAQVSARYPDARAALLELARANKIGPNLWPYLTPMLAGDQYYYQDAPPQPQPLGSQPTGSKRSGGGAHVVVGNQYFFTAPDPTMTPEQVNERVALINQLRAATSDAAALKALDAASALLANRLASVMTARSLPQ